MSAKPSDYEWIKSLIDNYNRDREHLKQEAMNRIDAQLGEDRLRIKRVIWEEIRKNGASPTILARGSGVSRNTAYVWMKEYEAEFGGNPDDYRADSRFNLGEYDQDEMAWSVTDSSEPHRNMFIKGGENRASVVLYDRDDPEYAMLAKRSTFPDSARHLVENIYNIGSPDENRDGWLAPSTKK